jgi:hypothetical protein
MKNLMLFTAIILTYHSALLSQVPDTMWTKTYGGTDYDVGNSVQQTSDGGYIITGKALSFSAGNYDVGLLKTDSYGNLQWLKLFGGTNEDCGNSVLQTSDGGYIVVGYTFSFDIGAGDLWLIKTDSNGNLTWSKTFGGTSGDIGVSIQQISGGGYIIAGSTASFGAGLGDVWLIKTDSSGNEIWSKTFGGTDWDIAASVTVTSDGGYVVTGNQSSISVGNTDVGLLKADSNGNLLWFRNFGGTQNDGGNCVKETTDGGFIITGYTASFTAGGNDVWLIKTDSDGVQQWSKSFGGTQNDAGYSVVQSQDGGYVVAGVTNSFGAGGADIGLLKTDSLGNLIWITSIGGPNADVAKDIKLTSDGGYIITGATNSFGAGLDDVWLVKLEPDITSVEENVIVKDYILKQNYPNPFNPTTTIKWQQPETGFVTLKIYDVLGKEVITLVNEELISGMHETVFDASRLSSGIYLYQLKAEDPSTSSGHGFIQTKKMILLK